MSASNWRSLGFFENVGLLARVFTAWKLKLSNIIASSRKQYCIKTIQTTLEYLAIYFIPMEPDIYFFWFQIN